jgi:hypothetical protein
MSLMLWEAGKNLTVFRVTKLFNFTYGRYGDEVCARRCDCACVGRVVIPYHHPVMLLYGQYLGCSLHSVKTIFYSRELSDPENMVESI